MIWITCYDQDHPTTYVISTQKTLQELNVHNTMKIVETQYHVTQYWWLYSNVGTKEMFL